MTRLRLEIDHLVLDGVDAGRAAALQAELEAEMERRLAERPAAGPPGAAVLEQQISTAVAAVLSSPDGRDRRG